jgi:hypothetical protein
MKTITQIQILSLVCIMSSATHAVEFQAFAPVLHVEPVMETRYEPVTRRVCTEPGDSARKFSEVAASIGEDVRSQRQLWQQQHHCRDVTEQRASEHITGYRVTYRYGEETATIRMSYDPGDQVPVSVSLSPLK